MKINQLAPLDKIPYFTITGFRQVLDGGDANEQRVRELLSRWVKRGHIIRLKRGVYMTRNFYQLHRNDPSFSPAVSAMILPQSYLSLEYVLQRQGILTEVTYPLTAVTPKNTRTVKNSLGQFDYRHIKLPLYTGFQPEVYAGVHFNLASAAKALFDFLYFRPLPRKLRTHKIILAAEHRLNLDQFSQADREEFAGYVQASSSPKMTFILENLRRSQWQD